MAPSRRAGGQAPGALAGLLAALMLVAACGGGAPPAAPAVTGSADSPSTSVEADDQARDQSDTGTEAGSMSGPTEGAASATEPVATAEEPSDAAATVDGSPSGSEGSDADPSDDGASEDGSAATPSESSHAGAGPAGEPPEFPTPPEVPEVPETEPLVAGPFAALTGLITTDLSLDERRPLAVKIGNGDPEDRPQAGLGAADIVYEVLVEAGKTRFIAVFHSQIPDRIGPVRSVRSSDFAILEDLSTPYLASSGANRVVRREMRQAAAAGTLIDIGAHQLDAPYKRDRSRPAPHNLYFLYENLAPSEPASPPEALFEYGSPNPPGLPDAAGVAVAYRTQWGSEVAHVWDSIGGGWVRIQDGTVHTTETANGTAEIAPANVVVVRMPYGRSAADPISPQALPYGSGEALVLTSGAVHEAQWERSQGRVGFRFTDRSGNPLSLSAGATWLLLANDSGRWPIGAAAVLTESQSEQLLADARAAAS